jgi:hypothetical protein
LVFGEIIQTAFNFGHIFDGLSLILLVRLWFQGSPFCINFYFYLLFLLLHLNMNNDDAQATMMIPDAIWHSTNCIGVFS